MAESNPILFVLGPSGVGKSSISKGLEKHHRFLHIDIDKNRNRIRGFELNHFPAEWDEDINGIDFAALATEIYRRVTIKQSAGAVVSFPTIHVFSAEQLEAAFRVGITTVVLWATQEQCIEARRKRGQEKGRKPFSVDDYKKKNRGSFEAYARSEYGQYRIEVFRPDGSSHWPSEHVLALIMARATGR